MVASKAAPHSENRMHHMATLDDKLDALHARLDYVETLRDESDPESESLFSLGGQCGNIASHLEAIEHEILMLTDEPYAAEVSIKLEEAAAEVDAYC